MDRQGRQLERLVTGGDPDAVAALEAHVARTRQPSAILSGAGTDARRRLADALRQRTWRRTGFHMRPRCPECLDKVVVRAGLAGLAQDLVCGNGCTSWLVSERDPTVIATPGLYIQIAMCVSWHAYTEREALTGPDSHPDSILYYNGPETIGVTLSRRALAVPMCDIPTVAAVDSWLDAKGRWDRRNHPLTIPMLNLVYRFDHDNVELHVWAAYLQEQNFRYQWEELPPHRAYDDPCNRPVPYRGGGAAWFALCDLPQRHDGACMVSPLRDALPRRACE